MVPKLNLISKNCVLSLGSRHNVVLWIEGNETPVMALQRILGDEMENIEVKLNYTRMNLSG